MHLFRFVRSLLWHWHNAVAAGVVGLSIWRIGPPTLMAAGLILGLTLVWAAFRLAWVEFWRNRGLRVKLERVFMGDRMEGVEGRPLLLFCKLTNLSADADQADEWRLTYRLPKAKEEMGTIQVKTNKAMTWGPHTVRPEQRLDLRAFQSVARRSALRGYLLFGCPLATAELPMGTRLSLSFSDLVGGRVVYRTTLKEGKKPDLDLPLGLE